MSEWPQVAIVCVAATGWGLAAYLWVKRRQEHRLREFEQAVVAAHRANKRPVLQIVRPVQIGSELGNDDVTTVGPVPR